MFRTIFAAGLIACSAVQPVRAQQALPSHPVNVADLDLTSESGQARLDRRLKRAVFVVCGAKIVGDAVRNARIDECRTEALANARKDAAAMIAARTVDQRLADRSQ